MNYQWRRRLLATAAAVLTAATMGAGAAVAFSEAAVTTVPVATQLKAAPVDVPLLTYVTRIPEQPAAPRTATQIPVLAYHAMNDRCAPAEITCKSSDYESVSARQFATEINWLYSDGYHTVTMDQYEAWLSHREMLLPPKPVLLMADNGDSDFLLGAEPVLYHYRYTLTAVIVTGFADAATSGHCLPLVEAPNGLLYNIQDNCGGPNTWNATWTQLRALSPLVYNYALEAGPAGHFQQDYNAACTEYYTCKMPGESDSAYEHRVTRDIRAGLAELTQKLPGRVNANAWTAPYSDLGYTCRNNQCPEEQSTGPGGWLVAFAAANFRIVFVQTPSRNGVKNERFRYEIHNTTTIKQFRQAIGVYLREGTWSY